LQICGRAHYRATRINFERRTQLDEPVECPSAGDPLLLYKILHLLFFLLVRILCACLESRKNYHHVLDAVPWEFQFLRLRGYLTNQFRTLLLCFGVTSKTPGLISGNNFVKKFLFLSAIAMQTKNVWNKTCTQLSLSQILFQNPKNYSLGDVHRF